MVEESTSVFKTKEEGAKKISFALALHTLIPRRLRSNRHNCLRQVMKFSRLHLALRRRPVTITKGEKRQSLRQGLFEARDNNIVRSYPKVHLHLKTAGDVKVARS